MKESIFKAYDIRGIYPTDLNEKDAQIIARAIYTFFAQKIGKKNLNLAVGKDMRSSSNSITRVVIKEFVKMGGRVTNIGLTTTPTFYFSVLKLKFDAGLMVTASHNPKEYSGMKFDIREGKNLIKVGKGSGMEEIAELSKSQKFASYQKGGKEIKRSDTLKLELQDALKQFDPSKFQKFKIVTDTANGVAILYLNELFKVIRADVVRMNEKLDGTFPAHEANPLKFETLRELQKRVVKEKADFGIAPDADGDRIFFIDEKGSVIPATAITSLITREVLRKKPESKILVDIRYIRNVQEVCRKFKGTSLISKVGHAFITKQLQKEGALFAGESSGHYFFQETGGAENSLRVALYVINVLSREKKPLSKIVEELTTSVESGEFNFELPADVSAAELLEKLTKKYSSGKISTLDGIAISFKDWRFGVRTSNTEPVLRLNIEGADSKIVQKYLKEISSLILKTGAKRKS